MSLDHLLQQATISFPRPLTARQVESLFIYLRQVGGLVVNYRVCTVKQVGEPSKLPKHYDAPRIHDQEIEKGRIIDPRTEREYAFTCPKINNEPASSPSSFFSGMQFSSQGRPGRSRRTEYHSEQAELCQAVRGVVEKYFREQF